MNIEGMFTDTRGVLKLILTIKKRITTWLQLNHKSLYDTSTNPGIHYPKQATHLSLILHNTSHTHL